jgi:spore germination cell wall hydrolase CwlJ-like protein
LIRTLRAAGLAAAAFGLAVGATFADPSVASQSTAGPDLSHYSDHASALTVGELLPEAVVIAPSADETQAETKPALETAAAPEAAAPAAPAEEIQHAIAAVTSSLLNFANAILPGPQSLEDLVGVHASTFVPSAEQECLAGAVYFEARGEPLDGQLAVAEVVLNRMASGKYPTSICAVVKQPWQFSFVRNGRFPPINKASESWRQAVAIAHIARTNLADELDSNVLWYHATYVAPSWGRRLTRVGQIGAHIFYS